MAKGGTLLAAMGLDAVLSAEERKKVADNLKQSGDEDHEVRGGLTPTHRGSALSRASLLGGKGSSLTNQ